MYICTVLTCVCMAYACMHMHVCMYYIGLCMYMFCAWLCNSVPLCAVIACLSICVYVWIYVYMYVCMYECVCGWCSGRYVGPNTLRTQWWWWGYSMSRRYVTRTWPSDPSRHRPPPLRACCRPMASPPPQPDRIARTGQPVHRGAAAASQVYRHVARRRAMKIY